MLSGVSLSVAVAFASILAATILLLVVAAAAKAEGWQIAAFIVGSFGQLIPFVAPDRVRWLVLLGIVVQVANICGLLGLLVWTIELLEPHQHRDVMRSIERARWFGGSEPSALTAVVETPGVRGFTTAGPHFDLAVAAGNTVALIDRSEQVDTKQWRKAINEWREYLLGTVPTVNIRFIQLANSPHMVRQTIKVDGQAVQVVPIAEAGKVLEDVRDRGISEINVPLVAKLLSRTKRSQL